MPAPTKLKRPLLTSRGRNKPCGYCPILTKCCILNAAPEARQLRFEEDELPPHLQTVMSSRVEAIDDPLFLGVRSIWPELKSVNSDMGPELDPALPPSKMDEVQLVTLRIRIRAAIATQLNFEPKKLPILEAYEIPTMPLTQTLLSPLSAPAQRGPEQSLYPLSCNRDVGD